MRNNLWIGSGISGMGEIPILGNPEKGLAKIMRGLFANSEQGFFYDPSDMTTVYQDTAGTIPVTAQGQPVGLMLDKSKGLALGPEIIINGNFSGSSNWFVTNIDDTHFVDFTADGARYYSASNTPIIQLRPSAALVPGKWYRIEVTTSGNIVGAIKSDGFIPGNLVLSGTQAGTYVTYGQARGTALFILRNSAVVDITIKSVSVKEILGNHAYQATSAARPILQQTPILGSELIVNGDFSNGLGGWQNASTTTTVENGRAKVTYTNGGGLFQDILVTAGKTYIVSKKVENISGATPVLFVYGSVGFSSVIGSSYPSTSALYVKAVSSNIRVYLNKPGVGEAYWDDVSVKEVTGYRTDQNYIVYDGVDDKLITNLPAPLTNATVLRAVPGVGTQVKYSQTLPMLYEDATNHSGLIAINRALTRSEQLKLMTELDKKAGATSLETLTFKAFDNNQQGFVYEPNDLTTMYQDAAGTIPVTTAGQPVGLILDKKNPALVGGEVSVDITNWVVSGSITKVGKNTFSSQSAANGLFYDGEVIEGLKVVELHYTVTGGTVQICDALGTRVRAESTQPSGVLKATFYPDRSSSPLGRIYFRLQTAGTTLVIDKLIVHTYTGNHAFQTTSASRPILRKNTVTGANYLEFDGSDDFLQTANIDFTATDKVSLFAGLNELSAGIQVIAELGTDTTNTQGSYLLSLEGGRYSFKSRGSVNMATVQVARTSTVNVPDLSVVSAKGNVLGDSNTIKRNGVSGSPSTADLGLGNYGKYPLYIGRRAGTSLPFTGHIYGLIGIGKLTTDTETTTIEKELAKRVGVTLNV